MTFVVAVLMRLLMSRSEPYCENSDIKTLAFGAITAAETVIKPGSCELLINENNPIRYFVPYNVRIFNSLFDFRAYVEFPC